MDEQVHIDRELCISAGRCMADAGGYLAFDDEELPVVVPGATAPDPRTLLALARLCPSGALSVRRPGGEVLEPG